MEDKMVELARFDTSIEAEMLVSLLQAEGIDSYVHDALTSQVFMGYADIGGAKIKLLEKDLERAREIMRDNGYDVSREPDEAIEEEDAEMYREKYEKSKARLSKIMTLIVICLLVILVILIILNRFYK
jgi:hypothetical protein